MRMLITLMILIFMTTGCAAETRTITGTVVDAESGKPIEGAVVLVEWTKAEGVPGLASTKSYKVVEAVTDRNGQFSVEDVKKILIDPPDVTVYKKGYVAWSSRIIFPDWGNRTDFKWGNYTFKLEHFKPEYSYDEHVSFIGGAINSSLGGDKNLIKKAYRWEELNASKELNEKWGKQKGVSQ